MISETGIGNPSATMKIDALSAVEERLRAYASIADRLRDLEQFAELVPVLVALIPLASSLKQFSAAAASARQLAGILYGIAQFKAEAAKQTHGFLADGTTGRDEHRAAVEAAGQALAFAEQAGDEGQQLITHVLLGRMRWTGEPDPRREHLQAALKLAREQGEDKMATRLQVDLHQLDDAEAHTGNGTENTDGSETGMGSRP